MPEPLTYFGACKTREDCARVYARLLVEWPGYLSEPWPAVNSELLGRYTLSGLCWIKRRAWKIAQSRSAVDRARGAMPEGKESGAPDA